MSKKRQRDTFNVENLDKWIEWLESLETTEIEKFKSRVLRTGGLRVLEYADDLTPRRSGRLQNSLSRGDKENVFELKIGRKTSYVFVGTAVEYARYVEEGVTQRAGQYVPGFWRNGVFHYRPGHPEGMVLTGKVIPGARMFEKALDYWDDDIDQVVEFEFRRLYAELFK